MSIKRRIEKIYKQVKKNESEDIPLILADYRKGVYKFDFKGKEYEMNEEELEKFMEKRKHYTIIVDDIEID